MASIKKRPDGMYRARYRDGDGKEHARHFTRKVDAQKWLDQTTAAIVTGTYVAPKAGRVTFQSYAENWRLQRSFRPSTAALVELALRKRVYPLIGDRRLETLTKGDVQALVAKLNETYAPATVSVTYSYVSSVLKDAVQNKRIPTTPCVDIDLREVEKKRVVPRTSEELWAVCGAVPARLRAAAVLAAGTGLRRGEVFGLTADRVAFLERRILVDRQLAGVADGVPRFGPPKTKASVREIPLPTSVAEALARHMEKYPPGPEGLLFTNSFGRPWQWSAFGDAWRAAAKAAGVPGFDFHELRHYYASLLIRHGESVKTVQARLGHKSAEETMNTYAHLWPDADDRTREAVDAALLDPADSLRTGQIAANPRA